MCTVNNHTALPFTLPPTTPPRRTTTPHHHATPPCHPPLQKVYCCLLISAVSVHQQPTNQPSQPNQPTDSPWSMVDTRWSMVTGCHRSQVTGHRSQVRRGLGGGWWVGVVASNSNSELNSFCTVAQRERAVSRRPGTARALGRRRSIDRCTTTNQRTNERTNERTTLRRGNAQKHTTHNTVQFVSTLQLRLHCFT